MAKRVNTTETAQTALSQTSSPSPARRHRAAEQANTTEPNTDTHTNKQTHRQAGKLTGKGLGFAGQDRAAISLSPPVARDEKKGCIQHSGARQCSPKMMKFE